MIINANENDAIVCEQLARQEEARVHRGQPRGVVAAARLWITGLEIALCINLSCQLKVGLQRFSVVIGIDEVVAGVVGRIDVDGFDAPEIGLIEELEDLKVVSLDEEVLGGVKMAGVVPARF